MLTPRPEPSLVPVPPAAPDPAPVRAASGELRYLSGRIPKELRDEFQHQAIREDRPVVQLLQDAVRLYLDQHAEQDPRARR